MSVETIAPVSASQSSPARVPGALRHGLTATRYVSPDRQKRIAAIRDELVRIHHPQSDEEREIIEKLALERARLYDAEAAHDHRVRWERLHAEEIYDRHSHERFEADLKAAREDPRSMRLILPRTLLGAMHACDLWSKLITNLLDSRPIEFDLVREILVIEGLEWRVGYVDIKAREIFVKILAVTPERDAFVAKWLAASRPNDLSPVQAEFDRAYIARMTSAGKEPKEARDDALRFCRDKLASWDERVGKAQTQHFQGRALAAGMAFGLAGTDAESSRDARLTFRYLISTTNRVEKLERRLESLKRMRPLNDLRANGSVREPVLHWPEPAFAIPESDAPEALCGLTQSTETEEDASVLRNRPLDRNTFGAEPLRSDRRPDPAAIAKAARKRLKAAPRT